MIDRQEVMDFSREFGLAAQVIEKDYVLGWLLAGISQHAVLGSAWVFKGGTCLKKCYFETYRFSEDLDFTIRSLDHLDESFLKTHSKTLQAGSMTQLAFRFLRKRYVLRYIPIREEKRQFKAGSAIAAR